MIEMSGGMAGEEARQAGLATVQRHLATLNALLDTCAAMQHRTSMLLPGAAPESEAHAWDAQSIIAESVDGMVEDVHYEDAAEEFSHSPGTRQLNAPRVYCGPLVIEVTLTSSLGSLHFNYKRRDL